MPGKGEWHVMIGVWEEIAILSSQTQPSISEYNTFVPGFILTTSNTNAQ